MPENKLYPPEGLSAPVPLTLSALRDAQSSGAVLEATALRCDAALCLHFQFGSVTARMPREEVTAPWITGAGRDIAVLSRVGKPMFPPLFQVVSVPGCAYAGTKIPVNTMIPNV